MADKITQGGPQPQHAQEINDKAKTMQVSVDEEDQIQASSRPSKVLSPARRKFTQGIKWVTQKTVQLSSTFNESHAPPRFEELDENATLKQKLWKFATFLGPGAIISVAYIDPDNYQTNIAAGASFQYKQLFMLLVSILMSIYIQAICVKLGTVTGMDLAQMNHKYLPRWLELSVYAIGEAAIICTDVSQVLGTAVALNLLAPRLPLWGGCLVSMADTLFILIFYTPTGQLRKVRIFEFFVAILVSIMFINICIALGMVSEPARDVLDGFLPSKEIFTSSGLYESCAFLGGMLMPHSLYVGTSLSRARLYDYDLKHHLASDDARSDISYRPSLRAIKSCKAYSIAELTVTLFIVGTFINGALVIISGSAFFNPTYSNDASNGDLFTLYKVFYNAIGPAAATVYALALLFSGLSAGIVATMAGNIMMDGALNIRLSPFVRRLLTRSIALVPAVVIVVSLGRDGIGQALLAINYILAITLIVVTTPIVYFSSREKYMLVPNDEGTGTVSFKNSPVNIFAAVVVWLVIVFMNVATMVLLALGLSN